MVPATVQFTLPIEVDEINEQLFTDTTCEACWMPASVGSCTGCEHTNITTRKALLTLQQQTEKLPLTKLLIFTDTTDNLFLILQTMFRIKL
jgi:hypothetical protein